MIKHEDLPNHSLEVIIAVKGNYGDHTVVRWCSYCGAIVVDTDVDNRIIPGNVVEMKFPKLFLKRGEL